MRNFFLTLAMSVLAVSSAHALQISIVPGTLDVAQGDTGQLEVIIDTSSDPDNLTFVNGGIGLDVSVSNPSAFQIDSFEVNNIGFFATASFDRWSGTGGTLNNGGVDDLFGFSVQTRGLNDSAPTAEAANGGGPDKFLFATLNYSVVGGGDSTITISPSASRGDSAIFSNNADVSGAATFPVNDCYWCCYS